MVSTHVIQCHQWCVPAAVSADGKEQAVFPNCRSQLLNEKDQQRARNGRQVEIVDEEQVIELECRARSHQFSTSKNNSVIRDQHHDSRFEGQHRCRPGVEVEFIGWVTHGSRPYFVEYPPWRKIAHLYSFGIQGALRSAGIRHGGLNGGYVAVAQGWFEVNKKNIFFEQDGRHAVLREGRGNAKVLHKIG